MKPLKLGVISLGCSKNRVDTEYMLGILKRRGVTFTSDPKDAEAILINTCGFIGDAKQESINTILEMAEFKKTGKLKCLIVAGCLSQRYGQELADEMPEVDVFLGAYNFEDIADALEYAMSGRRFLSFAKTTSEMDYSKRFLTTPHYSAYVKIGEGCSNCCSYCAIPLIKGQYRSRSFKSVIDEIKKLADGGVKEIVLISQDTTKFGTDTEEGNLADLLRKMRSISGIEWIRVLYTYPDGITKQLIETMLQDARICKYLDMPIQHISNGVLKAMNRKSSKEQIYKKVDMIRSLDKNFSLRTSLITGFPGETRDQHAELMSALKELCFDNAGVFIYSQEEGTKAAKMEQLPDETKKMRYEELMRVQANISAHRNEKRLGREYDVLVEGFDHHINRYYGRAYFQAPEVDGKIFLRDCGKELKAGEFMKTKIEKAYDYDLLGVLI